MIRAVPGGATSRKIAARDSRDNRPRRERETALTHRIGTPGADSFLGNSQTFVTPGRTLCRSCGEQRRRHERARSAKDKTKGETQFLNKDPFAQANQCMHDIIDLVRHRFRPPGGELPFTYGAAVAFPDCEVSGTLPQSIQPELVLDVGRLRDGDGAVRRVIESFRRARHREPATARSSRFARRCTRGTSWFPSSGARSRTRKNGCAA